jgi:transcriptional regulator with XRE-family HTH domain
MSPEGASYAEKKAVTRAGLPGDVASVAEQTKTLACINKTRRAPPSISQDKNCSAASRRRIGYSRSSSRRTMATRDARPVDVLVGQNIRICRMQRGLSQSELAERVGLTFQQIQKYEKAANRVGASRLIQVADALGVPLATLFEGSPSTEHGEADPSGRALLVAPHALRLLQAFDQIPDTKRRAAVLHLIESIGKAFDRRRSVR